MDNKTVNPKRSMYIKYYGIIYKIILNFVHLYLDSKCPVQVNIFRLVFNCIK